MHSPSYIHADYLGDLIRTDSLKSSIRKMCEAISRFDFDAVAFMGISGMLLGPGVAMQMGKTMLVVRKEIGEASNFDSYCHSGLWVEGDYGARRYIVVDDLICSGKTFRTIQHRIRAAIPEAKCIGLRTVWDIRSANYCLPLHKPEDEMGTLCVLNGPLSGVGRSY
jgi:adenine/guanine phosphoribosyltransferase-like PRPP-binding protein